MLQKYRSLEESLLLLTEQEEALSLQEVLNFLSGKGRLLIVLILALPFCLPIQIPGLSMPFGLAITFFGLRIAFGKRIWLPKTMLIKSIPATRIRKIASKSLWLVRKMKRWAHPRLNFICHHVIANPLNGSILAILGLFLALPLPIPLTNLVAAWSILLISFGLLEDDGLFVLVGYGAFALTSYFFIFLGGEIHAIYSTKIACHAISSFLP